jgi:hypothetical protein
MTTQCDKCKSDNTQRLEIVYQQGTQSINTRSNTLAVGMAGGGVGSAMGHTRTSGTAQSMIAKSIAPPAKRRWFRLAIIPVVFGAGFLLAATNGGGFISAVIGLALLAGGGYILYMQMQYNSQTWPGMYKVWQESWLCNKCGNVYHQAP